MLLHKNIGSWSSLASACRTWAHHRDLQGLPHFAAATNDVLAFSTIFKCGATLANYVAYPKTAHILLGHRVEWDPDSISAVRKGSTKVTIKSSKAVFRLKDTATLIAHSRQARFPEDADFFAIAYHFMLRVQDELQPLRLEPRQAAEEKWHSLVTTSPGNPPVVPLRPPFTSSPARTTRREPPSRGPAPATPVHSKRPHAASAP